jgi:two-component system, chemotaxis family, response regulator PixG
MSTSFAKLFENLDVFNRERFTGYLTVCGPNQLTWILYFYVGKLVGDGAGIHPARRWRRQLLQHCPNLNDDIQNRTIEDGLKNGTYYSINALLKNNHVSRVQASKLLEESLLDTLFDILYLEMSLQHQGGKLNYSKWPEAVDRLEVPKVWSKVETLCDQVKQVWQEWFSYGLNGVSPNFAPQILDQAELQRLVGPVTYKMLREILDGDRTLRDIAFHTKQDLNITTCSISTYCKEGAVCLVEVPDIVLSNSTVSKQTLDSVESKQFLNSTARQPILEVISPKQYLTATTISKRGLIAHIDDSTLDIQIMKKFVMDAGYQYVSVQNPVRALETILEQPPDLIFLDLVMPFVNGYEVCAQFRRISRFKETPIIFLTGNDGLFDRVRAKMVKSTAFLCKPVNAVDVLEVLQKYIPTVFTNTNGSLDNQHQMDVGGEGHDGASVKVLYPQIDVSARLAS